MRSEGHVDAIHYPIWMVWEELTVVQRRLNQQIRTNATSMMMAVGAAQTGGRKGMKMFKDFLENFGGEDN